MSRRKPAAIRIADINADAAARAAEKQLNATADRALRGAARSPAEWDAFEANNRALPAEEQVD